ncbi:M16 family metallopeptidase [Sphingomonas solaris]|uniref:Insulinase family protein n=1 Tax=Alterirhizorhabdus solaris TaxID=2529389 RepID=A0A558RBP3_9SPHN|nr:pitrilysin family protein [Sphingomonas solaris]TVV76829.1 insulinase family protein [Sphingomonas solaris]
MFRPIFGSFAASLAAGLLATSSLAAAPAPTKPAPVADLVKAVAIPYSQFTLPNGLRVIVHTDRKAPVVALSVWYHIGSKDEPADKTGFAHLFEHLMFNGSENANEDFFKPLETVGATDTNGTTSFDRTNYFETVPTGALEFALFLESDRMGHLLGAIDKTKLDNQRGVVQNEKRSGDNQPYGLVEYAQLEGLFPPGHPYRHSTIGSMADLDGASLEDVKNWFRAHYGPNNAVLVLAGDIDAATARPLVEKWFGGIPRGPETPRPAVAVPTLAAPVERVMHDRVATTRIYRNWTAPGLNDPDAVPLDIALTIIGGLSSSRLDNALVRQDKTAVSASASLQELEKVSLVEITANVRPGVDPKVVSARLDALIADFLKTGPTADEVARAATREVAGRIAGLESVGGFGGKAVTLAEGAVYSDDPEKYAKDLAEYAAATPATVLAAARKWLGRPALSIVVAPGERSAADVASAGGGGGNARGLRYYRDPKQGGAAAPGASMAARVTPPGPPPAPKQAAGPARSAPPVKPIDDLVFPKVERTTLSNGIEVVLARRTTVPTVRVAVQFDAGNSADPKAKLGTQALTLALLDEGTKTRDSIRIAEEQERLGATIGSSAGMDSTTVSLFALKPNLAPSLDLLADVIRNPVFAPAEVERVRNQLLARIASEKTQPSSIALRELPPLLYGPAHPYGIPFTGSGTEAGVKAATRADLVAFQQAWFRPDNARIFVAGDITLAELKPQLEARFGAWAPAAGVAKGAKLFAMDRMARPSRILLIDRPQSPQSLILAGEVLPVKGTDDPLALTTANEVLGGGFLSRLNTDLREQKGWAYGVGGYVRMVKENVPYIISAPVQTDKTGASITAMLADMKAFLGPQGITAEERERTINNAVRSLPGSFETSGDLLGAIMQNALYGRPDDYYAKLADRYRALTVPQLDAAARKVIDPSRLIWIVVGDAAKVRPQLDAVGLPVELVKPAS